MLDADVKVIRIYPPSHPKSGGKWYLDRTPLTTYYSLDDAVKDEKKTI